MRTSTFEAKALTITLTDPRAVIARQRQTQRRADRERIRSLGVSDRAAETARQLQGQPGAPDDFGASGPAAVARVLVREDADAESAGSASRKGIRHDRLKVRCECVLDGLYYRENGALTEEQWRAGMRFRALWLASRHASRVSGDYGQRIAGSGGLLVEVEYRTDARIQIDRAVEMLTQAQRRAVVAICGEDERLGLREKSLRLGLTVLAEQWMVRRKGAR